MKYYNKSGGIIWIDGSKHYYSLILVDIMFDYRKQVPIIKIKSGL